MKTWLVVAVLGIGGAILATALGKMVGADWNTTVNFGIGVMTGGAVATWMLSRP